MKEVKVVVFDVDGVLIRCVDAFGNFLWQKNLERDLGISVQETSEKLFQKYWSRISSGKMDTLKAIGHFLNEIDVSLSPERFMAYWHENDRNVNEAMYSLAKVLRKKGYRVCIGTNQEKYRLAHIHTVLNREGVFENVFASCDIGSAKPDRDFFVRVQRQIGTPPSQILLVDDTKSNVDTAKKLHWHGHHFTSVDRFKTEVLARM